MVTGELSQSITSSLVSRVPESQYGYVGEERLKRGGKEKLHCQFRLPVFGSSLIESFEARGTGRPVLVGDPLLPRPVGDARHHKPVVDV